MSKPYIAATAPIAVELEEGKTYYWCTCGRSKSQPFCDGSHAGSAFEPLEYVAPKSGKQFLCQCKRTGKAPLCDGTHKAISQAELDEQADQANSTGAAQRAMTKGGNFYKNGSWDLVDGVNLENMDLSKVKEEDLPDEMKGMSLEEKEAFVNKKADERKALQEEIKKLTAERNKYVEEERKKLADEGDDTFDTAVQQVLETQLKTNGFKFKK